MPPEKKMETGHLFIIVDNQALGVLCGGSPPWAMPAASVGGPGTGLINMLEVEVHAFI